MFDFDFAAQESAYSVDQEFNFEQAQLEMVMRKLRAGAPPRPVAAIVSAPVTPAPTAVAARHEAPPLSFSFSSVL